MLFFRFNIELRGKNRSMLFQIAVQVQSFFVFNTNFHELATKSKIGSAESEISTKSIFQKLQLMTIRDIFLIIRVLYNFFFDNSCLIHPRRILMPLPNFISQPLRFKHFQPCTSRKQLSLEVGGGSQIEFKVAKVLLLIALELLLRVVQGQVAEITRVFS